MAASPCARGILPAWCMSAQDGRLSGLALLLPADGYGACISASAFNRPSDLGEADVPNLDAPMPAKGCGGACLASLDGSTSGLALDIERPKRDRKRKRESGSASTLVRRDTLPGCAKYCAKSGYCSNCVGHVGGKRTPPRGHRFQGRTSEPRSALTGTADPADAPSLPYGKLDAADTLAHFDLVEHSNAERRVVSSTDSSSPASPVVTRPKPVRFPSQAVVWNFSHQPLLPYFSRPLQAQHAPPLGKGLRVLHASAPVPSLPVVQAQYVQQTIHLAHWMQHTMHPWMQYEMQQLSVQRMQPASTVHVLQQLLVHHKYAAHVNG